MTPYWPRINDRYERVLAGVNLNHVPVLTGVHKDPIHWTRLLLVLANLAQCRAIFKKASIDGNGGHLERLSVEARGLLTSHRVPNMSTDRIQPLIEVCNELEMACSASVQHHSQGWTVEGACVDEWTTFDEGFRSLLLAFYRAVVSGRIDRYGPGFETWISVARAALRVDDSELREWALSVLEQPKAPPRD